MSDKTTEQTANELRALLKGLSPDCLITGDFTAGEILDVLKSRDELLSAVELIRRLTVEGSIQLEERDDAFIEMAYINAKFIPYEDRPNSGKVPDFKGNS